MRALVGPTLLESEIAQPRKQPFEIYDTRLSGFTLRVQPSGVRSYYARFGRKEAYRVLTHWREQSDRVPLNTVRDPRDTAWWPWLFTTRTWRPTNDAKLSPSSRQNRCLHLLCANRGMATWARFRQVIDLMVARVGLEPTTSAL